MIYGFEGSQDQREDVGTLTRHTRVRVLNCSAGGCLLEADCPIAVGTVGRLRVSLGGREFDDTIQVVRCNHLTGTTSMHHIGTRFLSTLPYLGSPSRTLRAQFGELAGWLDTTNAW